MALYDHRVFRSGSDYWVAQVHTASGAGWGDTIAAPTDERVFFKCLTDPQLPGKTARIPAGLLNRLSHRSIVALLNRSEAIDHGLRMYPMNAPRLEDLQGAVSFSDNDGLQWALLPSKIMRVSEGDVQTVAAATLVCLDDTALHGDVVLEAHTIADLVARGPKSLARLAELAKDSYEDWPSNAFELEQWDP